jgi:hypothetical protein
MKVYVGMALALGTLLVPWTQAVAADILHLAGRDFPLFKLVSAYILAALAMWHFARRSGLGGRLPRPIPGGHTISVGIGLFFAVPLFFTFAISQEIELPHLYFLTNNGLTMAPATIVLLLGSARVLLNARPPL